MEKMRKVKDFYFLAIQEVREKSFSITLSCFILSDEPLIFTSSTYLDFFDPGFLICVKIILLFFCVLIKSSSGNDLDQTGLAPHSMNTTEELKIVRIVRISIRFFGVFAVYIHSFHEILFLF